MRQILLTEVVDMSIFVGARLTDLIEFFESRAYRFAPNGERMVTYLDVVNDRVILHDTVNQVDQESLMWLKFSARVEQQTLADVNSDIEM